jgi:ribosomal protein L24
MIIKIKTGDKVVISGRYKHREAEVTSVSKKTFKAGGVTFSIKTGDQWGSTMLWVSQVISA